MAYGRENLPESSTIDRKWEYLSHERTSPKSHVEGTWPKELWPPFLGSARVREGTQPSSHMFRRRIGSSPPHQETPPVKTASIPTAHPARYVLGQGRNRGIPMKSDVLRSPMVLVAGFILGVVS